MAKIGETPTLSTPAVAKAALIRDLTTVLKGRSLEEAGWVRPDDLTLLIPFEADNPSGGTDAYLTRFQFGYYPEWPPHVEFINPTTRTYQFPNDQCYLPKLESCTFLHVHANYNSTPRQLVCCSFNVEFYLVNHNVEAHHVWDSERQNFASTINAIERALRSPYYKGRLS